MRCEYLLRLHAYSLSKVWQQLQVKLEGRTSRRAICGSIYHWARNCPDKDLQPDVKTSQFQEDTAILGSSQTEERTEESLISLNTGSTLWKECSGKAILDTACAGAVCG